MVKLYVRKIKDGSFLLENVPARWYDEVEATLIADGFITVEEVK